MANFDEVVESLGNCINGFFDCGNCKYRGRCGELNRDALELLKEYKDRSMCQPRVYENIYDAAAELNRAATYLEFCGDSVDDSMVNIITERDVDRVKIKFTIGQPNAAQWVWTIREKKKFVLPDLTGYHDSDFDNLRHMYDLLGLNETGGEITKDSLLHAAEKFDEKCK